MKRLLLALAVSFLAGIYAFDFLSIENFIFVAIALLLTLLLKALLFRRTQKAAVAMALCFLLGFSYINLVDAVKIRAIEPYIDEVVTLYARVNGFPKKADQRTSLTVDVFGVIPPEGGQAKEAGFKILLTIYEEETDFHHGDVLRVEAIPQWFETEQNEGGFDSANYYKSEQIWTRATVTTSSISMLDNQAILASRSLSQRVNDGTVAMRSQILNQIDRFFSGDAAALTKAVLLGYRGDLSDDLENAFAACGVSHLIAVSGMNVGIVFSLTCALLQLFTKKRRLISLVGMGMIVLFTLLAGCSVSVLRAAVMYILYLLSSMVGRERDGLTLLGFAGVLLALFNPFSVFSVSFILTFAATAGIMVLSTPFSHLLRFLPYSLNSVLSMTLSASITTFPFLAYYFNEVSVVTIIPNIILVPLLPVVMALTGLTIALGSFLGFLGSALAVLANAVLLPMLQLIYRIAEMPGATAVLPKPDALSILLYFSIVVLLYFFYRRERKTKIAVSAVISVALACCVFVSGLSGRDSLRVQFINVGQGDSTLLQFPDGRTMLIDGGGTLGPNDDYIGENVVLPFMRQCGVTRLDYAVISHYDADHAEGVVTLLKKGLIETLYTPPPDEDSVISQTVDELVTAQKVNRVVLSSGMALKSGDIRLDVLSPDLEDDPSNENDRSLVIMLRYGYVSFLFMGDCESDRADEINEAYMVKCNVLKVPHHGSRDSYSEEFAREALPDYAVISVGKNNMYGHPAEEVVDAYQNLGAKIYRTDENGNIEFQTDGSRIQKITTLSSKAGY